MIPTPCTSGSPSGLPKALVIAVLFILSNARAASAQSSAIAATGGLAPNLDGQMDRALRYRPEGPDFVIENGTEYFNRPLYGRNTAFRVDAGDKPEFTLYLPGRGGNLRLGIGSANATRWLVDAKDVVARYRPGQMLYEIRDPLLGPEGRLDVSVVAMHATDGLIVRAQAQAVAAGIELVWAYGGVNGERGARDGDIGTERVPISEYFQLKPEFCQNNAITIAGQTFMLRAQPATILGIVPPGATQAVADASEWASYDRLLGSVRPEVSARPVAIGRVRLTSGQPVFVALQRVAEGAVVAAELNTYSAVTAPRTGASTAPATINLLPPYRIEAIPQVFADAEGYYRTLRERVSIDTPDPFMNAAVGALNLAADAVWDEPQAVVMHGAIAWRSRLLGWRGPYAMNALGWHDRARRHFAYWATRQNTDPIPDQLPPPDENANLARSEAALHSNGDMSNSHYDMNAVYIDALLRHLLWTGDVEFARELWPVIERHLAWERRLFRREFGPDKLPLFEAYAVIWASDDLQYHGGGVTHSSAYNYYHNTMAARLARLLGKDATPYETEASLIAKGMRAHLWLPEKGTFAEFKDLLGNQLVHPSAGLWTFYHTMDSGVPTPQEAWTMAAANDRSLPRLPVRGPGVPNDADYSVLASTDWMPYSWSINNVVMGENVHTALGYWQAGRPDEAFRLTKSSLLAAMYMGICPGNVGSMSYLDAYRRESQRDFADGSGVLSRAIIEGLFGVNPDALAGELRISPGFPSDWKRATLKHPDLHLEFTREGATDRWVIGQSGSRFRTIRLRLPATNERVASVEVNGVAAAWTADQESVGRPSVEITMSAPQQSNVVTVRWGGEAIPAPPPIQHPGSFARVTKGQFSWWSPVAWHENAEAEARLQAVPDWNTPGPSGKYDSIDLTSLFNDRVTEIFRRGKYRSPRSPYVSLALPAQGMGAWAGHMNAMAEIDDTGLRRVSGENGGRLVMPNGVPFATPGPGDAPNILFTSQWDNYPRHAAIPISGRAARVYLLMAGSTNHMQSRIDNGKVVVTYGDGSTTTLALHNPTTWWPIEQDYFIDDFQFRRPGSIPPRINLRTGEVRLLEEQAFKGRGRAVPGGAATALTLPTDPAKDLRSLEIQTIANEVVIGLMSITLERP